MERESKDEALPPGFRFHPTDEELVSYYLSQKLTDSTFSGRAIADVDLNKCEPWDLPGKARMGEKEWYFFSVRDRKYPTGLRTNRATTAGYWKTTGKDKEICGGAAEVVGMKKTLVFYRGRAPRGEKTNWVMHEYRLVARSPYKNFKEEWVLCRVFQKSQGAKKPPVGQLRSNSHAHDWVAPSTVQLSPFHRQLGCTGGGYAELAELTRTALRGIHGIGSIMQPLLGGLTTANLAPGSPTWHPDAYAAQSLSVGVDSSPSCILQAEPPFQQAEAYADGGLWPSF